MPRKSTVAGLIVALVASARAAPGYEVVQQGGATVTVTSLAFSGESALLGVDSGVRTVPASSLDYYETFRHNLGKGGGNVVVFTTESLLRFESLEIADGRATVKTTGGATFVVPESLLDFEASVREGAMVRLPETAGQHVAVSTSAGASGTSAGGFVDDVPPPDDVPLETPEAPQQPGRSKQARPGIASRRIGSAVDRRMGGFEDRRKESEASENANAQDPASFEPGAFVPVDEPVGDNGENGNNASNGNAQQATGSSVLVVTTTYSGEVNGLQATVQFPSSLRVVEPVTFSGFATALGVPTVNTRQPGQIQIIAVTNPSPDQGIPAGGEFLRLTFTWTGRAPMPQQFAVDVRATDAATGGPIESFPKELSLF